MNFIRLMLVFVPFMVSAENFKEIKSYITSSYMYEIYKNRVVVAKKSLKEQKRTNYGSVEFSYFGASFFNTPTMKLTTLQAVGVNPATNTLIYKEVSASLPVSDKYHFIGEVKYSFPIFTGFAISNSIKKAKIKLIQSKLELKNIKRVLVLSAAKIYSGIYSLNQSLKALNFAKNALKSAREKVEALYKEGLVDKSEVDEIDAKFYETIAKIKDLEAKRINLYTSLATLLNRKVGSIKFLDEVNLKNNLNVKKRADVEAVYYNLEIAKIEEELVKSAFYPKMVAEVVLKREGDNFLLTKNDYQNVDKSFIGIGIKWNLFNGGRDKLKLEMVKISKLNALMYYKNYLLNAQKELKEDLNILDSLKYQLKSAKLELKARESYFNKIDAKFKEGLADSVDLNNAIAKLAEAKSKIDYIKSQIFFYTIKTNLDGGSDE